jgi:hypothetical protein
MSKKTGETTSPDRLLRFNGVYGRAQDGRIAMRFCASVTSP